MDTKGILAEARATEEWVVDLRRKIHRRPELMYEEVETSWLVRETLDALGIAYQAPIVEMGVLATVGKGYDPCVAISVGGQARTLRTNSPPTGTGPYGFKWIPRRVWPCRDENGGRRFRL